MIIIFGLGNPGRKFYKTRHNVGFQVVDKFKIENEFSNWRGRKKDFKALISEGKINNKKIILAKPQTFMNDSGKAVKLLTNFYKITRPGLVVIHDDIDLLLGKIKISKGRGSAGHKGVQSIINELGTLNQNKFGSGQAKDFVRFRVGIRPESCNFSTIVENVGEFVLQEFTRNEQKIIKETIEKTCQAIKLMISKGLEKTMSAHNSPC